MALGLNTSSDVELKALADDLKLKPFYIFAIDKFPRKIKTGYYIINSNTFASGGSHWIALYCNKDKSEIFDPFGMPIDPRILRFAKQNERQGVHNTNQIQDIKSQSCGYWCLHFLHCKKEGMSMFDYLAQFSKDYKENENLLEEFWNV